MIEQITSLHTETIVLLIALVLALINALVAAFRGENWFKLGKQALANQNLSSAIHYFSQEILSHPNNIKAYLARAESYRQNEETEKALVDEHMAYELSANETENSADKKTESSFSSPFRHYASESRQTSLS